MSSSQRRQIMQPWPLCLVPFAKTKERSALPKYYSRVSSIARSSATNSGGNLDCASNTTLATNASPFNSQTALIVEKKKLPAGTGTPSTHYYAENLRNQKALTETSIYNPLDREIDDYKQIDPLLVGDHPHTVVIAKAQMSSQDIKPPKDAADLERLAPSEFQKPSKPAPKQFIRQILAALSLSVGSMVIGFSASYTSPGLVSMQEEAPFEVDMQIGMWIGSIMPLSAFFGGIVGGPLIDFIGRRNTILSTAIPFIVAWLFIGLAVNVPMILVGRAISGFCVGIASLSLPVYLAETIQPEVRGCLGLLPTVFGNTGILICFFAGMYLNWSNLALLGACVPIPFLLLMFTIPETPRWYISKGNTKKARESLQWLRGKGTDISEELSQIESMHNDSERNANQGTFTELFRGSNMKPVLISLGLMFFQQMSGINAVIFYTVQIFKDAGSTVDENISTIIVGVVNFLSTFIAAVVIDKLGRKMLLYTSSISMIITLYTLGSFFYAKHFGADVSAFGWLPLLSLIVYVVGFSLGFGPIPWLMMGEILPVKIRGPAASVATGFNWMCTFIVTKTYEDLIRLIGAYGAFWLFGTVVLVGFFFVLFFVPETRGQSLEEIERRIAGPVRRASVVANFKPTPMAI